MTTTRAVCPVCDRGPRDRALAVTTDQRGTVSFCHRCSYTTAENITINAPLMVPIPRQRRAWADLAGPLWDRTQPMAGTLAEAYLKRRGCLLPPADGDLRFMPASEKYSAAMVAKITSAIDNISMTLHLTELSPTGEKIGRRLLAGYPKAGGVIRLWPNDAVTRGLAVAEGIETCLSAALAFTPIWSTIDAGNLSAFPVMQGIESLTIYADNDEAGINAARSCGRRWRDAGREARIRAPRQAKCDVNDIARSLTHEAA